MIIGNGLLANGFRQYLANEKVLIFASGVSNSSTTDNNAFEREKNLLVEALGAQQDKKFVYFSTCSIYDDFSVHSAYVSHKQSMEALIRQSHAKHFIFRVSNPIGKTHNPHTVFNYFLQHIINRTPFHVWKNAERNIIDIDDLVRICTNIIDNDLYINKITNVANPYNYTVLEIVQQIEVITGIKGNYDVIDRSSIPKIDISAIQPIIQTLGISFDKNYLSSLIKKYLGDI